MALQVTSQAARLIKAAGSFTELACGIAGGSGTSTTVTVPSLSRVVGVVAISTSAATAIYCDTTSGNTFTATHGNNETFMYLAWGIARM